VWLEGLHQYQSSQYQRPPCPHAVVWQSDGVQCLHVEYDLPTLPANAPVVLFIPSLINKYYILDLTPELSLVRHIRASSVRTYCLDWGEPQSDQAECDAGEYVTRYLIPLITWLQEKHHQPITVVGYCIGGLLALALAQLSPKSVGKLALLATPWDFDAHPHSNEKMHRLHPAMAYACTQAHPTLSGVYLSWLFYLADPVAYGEKYRLFAGLPKDSAAYARFIAVEHWVNDTVPLTRAFAHNCLIDWAGENHTAKLQWQVGGVTIDPAQITCSALLAVPKRDRIVPTDTALALAPLLKECSVVNPETGHIGMIIGSKRVSALWNPLATWIHRF
jgi:polyhydroxyalkanoate synthase subunit PhaC